jgi:hypothetical protein
MPHSGLKIAMTGEKFQRKTRILQTVLAALRTNPTKNQIYHIIQDYVFEGNVITYLNNPEV